MEKYDDNNKYYTDYEITNNAIKEMENIILSELLSLIDIKSYFPFKKELKVSQGDATNLFTDHIRYRDELPKALKMSLFN